MSRKFAVRISGECCLFAVLGVLKPLPVFVLIFTQCGCYRSLESKLESLKAEKGQGGCINYGSGQTESPVPSQKSEGHYPCGKEICKDEPSAGSFTCEALTSCSPECQIPATVSAEDTETKREVSQSFKHEKISIGAFYGGLGGTLRKRRGKRKRKDCSRDVKEASVGDSGFLDSADAITALRCIEHSTSECREDLGSSGAGDWKRGLTKDGTNKLLDVFNKFLEHKSASVFRHRLDSQVWIVFDAFQLENDLYNYALQLSTIFNTEEKKV